jgi:glycosyltransferase involved in cell wall biosynthesis
MPALNEEDTVAQVVRAVRDQLSCDVLVIDDGCTDRTAERALAAGARVLHHPFNLGVGAALRSGFRYAVEREYTEVVQIDADGQHDPSEVTRLLDALRHRGVDLVVGSRFEAGYDAGRLRRVTMRALSRVVSKRLGVPINDTTSGFRAFGSRSVKRFAHSYPSAYLSDTVEALLLAGDWGLHVVEVPVQMHPRMGGKPSAGGAMSAFHLLRLGLVILLHRVRRPMGQRRFVDVEA